MAIRPDLEDPMSATERHWLELDLDRTAKFHDPEVSRSDERALVQSEHAGTESMDQPCPYQPCPGTMQLRPTVGALQCPSCLGLMSSGGRRISDPRPMTGR
jgi:hypothetical protein